MQVHKASRIYFLVGGVVFWCFGLSPSPRVSLAGQQSFFKKNSEVSGCDIKFHCCDPRKWGSPPHCHPWPLWMISSVFITSGSSSILVGPGLCFRHWTLWMSPHTKVMMATSIKKSFNSDFLYLAYPSSEKSCHSNELASVSCDGRREGWGRGNRMGEGTPFKSSPCEKRRQEQEKEEPKAGYFYNEMQSPLVPSPLSLKPSEQFAKGINRPGTSFCLHFLCTQTSKQVHGLFPQNLQPPFTKLSSGSKCRLPDDVAQGGMQEGRGRFGVDLESWHTRGQHGSCPSRGNSSCLWGKRRRHRCGSHVEVASWLRM